MLQHFIGAVPPLLTAFWVLAAAAVVVTILPIPGIPTAFKDAVRLSAARGKLWSTRPTTLGALNDLSVPQAWFAHFYAIGLLCNGVLLVVAAGMLHAHGFDTALAPHTLLALFLFLLHLMRRLLETWYMMVYPEGARMHVIAYAFGMAYYIVGPLSILGDRFWSASAHPGSVVAWLQHLVAAGQGKAGAAGVVQVVVKDVAITPSLLQDACRHAAARGSLALWLGGGIMITGFVIQCHSHWLLSRLASHTQHSRQGRVSGKDDSGNGISSTVGTGPSAGRVVTRSRAAMAHTEHGHAASGSAVRKAKAGSESMGAYQIPRGGLFELVSCPHYLGEVVIYLGLALLTWPALRPRLMLLWVVVNLVLAAGATQQWYRTTFPRYPRNRWALIPGIY